jgi:tRNA modification GTPase
MDKRTIAAISTPLGPGGIGIIRISGPDALPILKKLFVFRGKKSTHKQETNLSFSSHHVYYGHLHEVESDIIIDEVLAFFMKGPNSYTREDVVEIQSHSGYVVLDRILSAIVDAGAELAKHGEFTQRAFLNGRIDLTQAEAVIDLINAPCEKAANIAVGQASGAIKDKIEALIHLVNELNGKCEAIIEFDESDDLALSESLREISHKIYNLLLTQVTRLIQSQKSSAIFYEGVLMTIAGVPNVGKSSLLNQLVEKEIAIVSEIPGTTRDVIREYLSIHGIPITLCDTAGLHETQDPIECIGIEKAQDHIERAELLLFVVEANRKLNSFEYKFLTKNDNQRVIVVINKIDIASANALKSIKGKINNFTAVAVSAKTGSGISDLRKLIFNSLVGKKDDTKIPPATPNLRQRKILEKIEKLILYEKEILEKKPEPELMADILGRIRQLLEEITGSTGKQDLYDYIFSQFCIGK